MGDAPEALARKFGAPVVGRFAALVRATEPAREEQARQIKRVAGNIGPVVVEFFSVFDGMQFTAGSLYAWVNARVPCSPGSADRIMRLLADEGRIAYRLEDRSRSLYRCGP